MIWFGSKIDKDYGWEFVAFHKNRSFDDGLSFIRFEINWDRYLADHTPRFEIRLELFNYTIFDFSIYYLWHRDDLPDLPPRGEIIWAEDIDLDREK